MEAAKAEVLAFTALPRAHWWKIWSTNPLERVNKEIERRARVVGTFLNDAAVIRLVGAVLADMHTNGSQARRYPPKVHGTPALSSASWGSTLSSTCPTCGTRRTSPAHRAVHAGTRHAAGGAESAETQCSGAHAGRPPGPLAK
jgi:hypothetical protein